MSVCQEHTIAMQMLFAKTLKDHLPVLVDKDIVVLVPNAKVRINPSITV